MRGMVQGKRRPFRGRGANVQSKGIYYLEIAEEKICHVRFGTRSVHPGRRGVAVR